MIDVKILQQSGHSVLVEYLEKGKLKRATIPPDTIKEGQVSQYSLKLGIPYGLPWAELITLKASPERLQEELHRIGIWTAEDALQNAQGVLGAIQATYGTDMSKIMAIAKKEVRKE